MKNYKELLEENNQTQISKYIEKANEMQKQNLINQIQELNFEELKKLYKISKTTDFNKDIEIEHLKYVDKSKLAKEEFEKLENIGNEIIKKGQYAVVTMAGGQGTRLGHDGPKGTFLLNVKPKPKYLFEIIADGLKRANKKYNITLNWYIMTSTENNKKTVDFFEEHNYFEYPKEHVSFFEQGNLPLLSEDGKILIDENMNVKLAADGNGCIYKAMKKNGVLDDMKSKGIKWIFIGAVDNALVNMTDPVLLGLTISQKNEIGSKAIVKSNPHEPVGVFCKKNGKPGVIEYSEISKEMAEATDENGELLYGESNIMAHLYNINALDKISQTDLPYHSAHKKANYLKEDGTMFIATEPNAYKYEAFIFDGFSFFDNMSVLRVRRDENFAPIKNKEGNDSPSTAIELYNKFWEKEENK
ncbi:MAG: UTP--glucose-1-phosphate uridylyltransferase [Bacilli bacterium]|nr:UTP--glucose-1-phosphate uridylyltransferase [Bacilli bacterium]